MTCKGCFHYEACKKSREDMIALIRTIIPHFQIDFFEDDKAKKCEHFKDRSTFTDFKYVIKKGSKLYYFYYDSITAEEPRICCMPDIVTAVLEEGFFVSTRIDSDGSFEADEDQFYYWSAIGTDYFLSKQETEQALKNHIAEVGKKEKNYGR